MNGIEVELVDWMGGDISISNSARVSFNKWKNSFDDKDENLIVYLGKHEHMTPFRHNCIQIRCKAPVFLARQLMKHQAGLTWNEVSRRYVDDKIEFFYPDRWRARPEKGIKQGSGEIHEDTSTISEGYHEWMVQLFEYYECLIDFGVAPEMARMVLPQSLITEWIWTGNLLAFCHVYNLRIKENAQKEAQVFAEKLKQAIEPIFPVGFKALTENSK